MKIYIVTGQTATGKTSYALDLAHQYDGELINFDSRQIYRKLNIITGKDLTDHSFHSVQTNGKFHIGYYRVVKDKTGAKIWLYDVIDPKEYFSSFDFQQCALTVLKDIISRKKTPILVGGTYFYLKHLLYGVMTEKIEPDWKLRAELETKTIDDLQNILKMKSPNMFNTLNESDENNPQRLIRKIEIANSGKEVIQNEKSYSIKFQDSLNKPQDKNIEIEIIGLQYKTKETLHSVIEKRVEERIQQGAIQEVEQLLKNGYTEHDPGLRTIGYQQIIKYLHKEISKDDAISEWITKEKQYAKRQFTFMKKDPNIYWKILE